MRPEVLGDLVNAATPFLGGLYAMLLGFRVVGTKPRQSLQSDDWHERYGKTLRVLGPLVALFGAFEAVVALIRPR